MFKWNLSPILKNNALILTYKYLIDMIESHVKNHITAFSVADVATCNKAYYKAASNMLRHI